MILVDSGRMASRLRQQAAEYAKHGWPVRPIGPDGRLIPGEPPLTSAMHVAEAWEDHGYGIAIVAAGFEIVEIPSPWGALLHRRLVTRCPTALVRTKPIRWFLYVEPGTADPVKVFQKGGVVHKDGDWAPAPPTLTPEGKRVGWIVPPAQARWRPYHPTDPFDALGLV